MYVLDTNVFFTLGHYFPSIFPSIWKFLNDQAQSENICSVKEVLMELDNHCPFEHIEKWVSNHKNIFKKPIESELKFVNKLFENKEFLGLVRRKNLLKGLPVADPFVISAAKIHQKTVVTQETLKPHGATIPNVCQKLNIPCINVERFFKLEKIKY
jgi:hypothetical protein